MSEKIAVLFPGKRYSCDLPLLYFANCIYRDSGYDVLNLTYPETDFEGKPDARVYEKIERSILAQAKAAGLDSYKEAVFISKSMGTVAAGWLAGKTKVPVRHIFLTPLEETFPYMKKSCVAAVLQGTADKWLEPAKLEAFCRENELRLVKFRDVGHRLEKSGDIMASIDNFRKVAELYLEDVSLHHAVP